MDQEEAKRAPSKFFVPSLVLSVFAASVSAPILTLLLSDIAESFFGSATSATTGISAQLSTATSIAEVAIGLLLGVLAIRFRHKSLLLVGLTFITASAIGSFVAPSFVIFQAFFILEGIGTIMVVIMAISLVGDTLTINQKPKAVSYIVAVSFVTLLIGTPIISFLTTIAGWRSSFLLYTLPITAFSLIFCYFTIPSKPAHSEEAVEEHNYVQTFKQVFKNRSAVACLIGSLFFTGAIGFFVVAFFRQQLAVSRDGASLIVLGSTTLFIFGSLVGGRLVSKVGAKPLAAMGALGDGVFIMLLFFAPSIWVGLTVNYLHVCFAAMAMSGFGCLSLDQVPKSRAPMMSLRSVFSNLGNAIGSGFGGLVLIFSSYQTLGFALGAMSIVSAVVVQFLSNDPYRPALTSTNSVSTMEKH
jgi:DHA1 family putative efflux transporter-like MFS transporter